MALSGKNTLIKVATTSGGAYSTVAEIKNGSMSVSGQNIDISAFGSSFVTRIQGLKDASYSISGHWVPTDTAGQVTTRNALINDSQLHIQFLSDGTAGFRQEVKVSKFDVSSAVDGVVELSIELEGTGVIVAV